MPDRFLHMGNLLLWLLGLLFAGCGLQIVKLYMLLRLHVP